MKWRNLGIVTALLLVLGAYVYYFEIQGEKKKEEAKEKEQKLFPIESKDVTGITLHSPEGEIVLVKVKDAWKLTRPLEAKADQSTADSLASDLASARIERTLEEMNPVWKTYGLDPPSLKLSFKLNNGKSHELELGEKDFSESYAYARVPGQNKVLLVSVSLVNDANKKLFDFRDKTLLEFKRDEVKALQITLKGKTYRLDKSGDNWLIQEPFQGRADRSEIDSISSELEYSKVEQYVDNPEKDLKTYGLSAPDIRLDLFLGENKSRKTLLIGNKVDALYYAKEEARDTIFKIKEDLYKKLNFDPQKIRDKKLFRFDRAEMTNLEVKLKDKKFVFFKGSDSQWKMSEPGGYKGKYITEYRLFWPLEDLEAKEFIEKASLTDAQYGFAQPEAEVRLIDKNKKYIELALGKLEKDQLYVKVLGDSTIYKVDKKVLDDLNFKLNDLIEK